MINDDSLYKGHTGCKKKDALDLDFEDYQSNQSDLLDGFDKARDLLIGERTLTIAL